MTSLTAKPISFRFSRTKLGVVPDTTFIEYKSGTPEYNAKTRLTAYDDTSVENIIQVAYRKKLITREQYSAAMQIPPLGLARIIIVEGDTYLFTHQTEI